MVLILQILQILLNVVWWVIIVQAILSWLIAFNVINTSNDFIRSVWYALQKMTDPLYRPIRRILPDFGALDLSPMVVLLAVVILDKILNAAIAQQMYGGAVVVG
ncbi:YggT family protein [Sphingomonas sp. SORGH_AS 950]|uniref:YggT family protein n=1 Tax=unclassified Sphingomonas TaxID=196159 RepID=UPI002783F0C9|nr:MULTISPECIES: YggT family protein [unclassified Sphingomonas]MDQ1157820.1 YggT family protein [Sphingomonas sp. SORGH_AS_0950]MDR6144550.1 YggT family protein [Sphingomonas sp. SORGH_AS_0870]